jgi:hypothetical protein
MLDMSLATEGEVGEALGGSFPKHPLHGIVCIGALVASRHQEGWRVDALGAPHIGERSEAELIRRRHREFDDRSLADRRVIRDRVQHRFHLQGKTCRIEVWG